RHIPQGSDLVIVRPLRTAPSVKRPKHLGKATEYGTVALKQPGRAADGASPVKARPNHLGGDFRSQLDRAGNLRLMAAPAARILRPRLPHRRRLLVPFGGVAVASNLRFAHCLARFIPHVLPLGEQTGTDFGIALVVPESNGPVALFGRKMLRPTWDLAQPLKR